MAAAAVVKKNTRVLSLCFYSLVQTEIRCAIAMLVATYVAVVTTINLLYISYVVYLNEKNDKQ